MLREVSKAGKETVSVCGDSKILERLPHRGLTDKIMMAVGKGYCLEGGTGRREEGEET